MNLIDEIFTNNNSINNTNNIEIKTYKDIWKKFGVINTYNRGYILGSSGDNSNSNLENFLKKFCYFLEEYIRSELEKNKLTSEEFLPLFKIMFFNFNSIIIFLKSKKITIDNQEFLALLNGFIDAYLEKNIK